MSGHLIALDKQPGVCLVGVGENWRHLFAKCVLKVTGPEGTSVCQEYQLYYGLNAGIDGSVHEVQAIWDTNLSTEYWGFLIVDAKNAFNKSNQTGILWSVCRLWKSGYSFIFKCYRHWSSLILRNSNWLASFLRSMVVVTRGGICGCLRYRHPPNDKNPES